MKIFQEKYRLTPYDSRIFHMYFGDMRLCVFDIETTGLFPRNDKLILSGLITVDNNIATVTQCLAETPAQEKEVVEETLKALASADLIITYNGRSFDLPFLQTRAKKHKLKAQDHYPELDLFQVLHRYSDLRAAIGRLTQKQVETFMGYHTNRDDEIDGGESVKLYERYALTQDSELEKTILLHNHDDIMQLYRILPVIEKSDFHQAMFGLGFPVKINAAELTEDVDSANAPSDTIPPFIITENKIKRDGLHITLHHESIADFINFPTPALPLTAQSYSASQRGEIHVPALQPTKGLLVVDAQATLGQLPGKLTCFPSLESGYLILEKGGTTDYAAVNTYIKLLVQKVGPMMLG